MLLESDNEERHQESCNMYLIKHLHCTYDHRLKNIGHPVRSAIHKFQIGRLVVGWVTTSEYLLLYVFLFFFSFSLFPFFSRNSFSKAEGSFSFLLEGEVGA
jgi:hypothetical protein